MVHGAHLKVKCFLAFCCKYLEFGYFMEVEVCHNYTIYCGMAQDGSQYIAKSKNKK